MQKIKLKQAIIAAILAVFGMNSYGSIESNTHVISTQCVFYFEVNNMGQSVISKICYNPVNKTVINAADRTEPGKPTS